MYTPIIQPSDLNTLIYQAKIDAITRGDSTVVTRAIDAGIEEVKSYLMPQYDTVQIFGDAGADVAASYRNEWLIDMLKDIVAWHLARLANVGMDITLLRTGYEDALNTLRLIQQGRINPPFPKMDISTIDTSVNSSVTINARQKRKNNW